MVSPRVGFMRSFKIKRDIPGQSGTIRYSERVGVNGDLVGGMECWDTWIGGLFMVCVKNLSLIIFDLL